MWRHRPSLAHRHTSRAGPADRGLSVDRGLCAKSCRHLSVHGARRSHSYRALQRPRLSPSLLPEPTSLTFGCHLASSPGPELVTTSKRRTLLTATAGPLRMESQCRRCLASCPLPKLRREGPAGEGCARIHVPLRHSEAGHGSPTLTCQAPSSQQADLGDTISR